MENVVIKMPTGENFLIETYDKTGLMEMFRKIEEVLKLTDEIKEGCLKSDLSEMVFDFFESSNLVINYSEFDKNLDYDFRNIV